LRGLGPEPRRVARWIVSVVGPDLECEWTRMAVEARWLKIVSEESRRGVRLLKH
jgi:hypothetical protein